MEKEFIKTAEGGKDGKKYYKTVGELIDWGQGENGYKNRSIKLYMFPKTKFYLFDAEKKRQQDMSGGFGE